MKIRIQLNVNMGLRIHYENIFIIFSILIKYLFNIPLFQSIPNFFFFKSQIFPEIYNLEWAPDTQI
jgi:hypothetical protein